jgi:hypothetical protein
MSTRSSLAGVLGVCVAAAAPLSGSGSGRRRRHGGVAGMGRSCISSTSGSAGGWTGCGRRRRWCRLPSVPSTRNCVRWSWRTAACTSHRARPGGPGRNNLCRAQRQADASFGEPRIIGPPIASESGIGDVCGARRELHDLHVPASPGFRERTPIPRAALSGRSWPAGRATAGARRVAHPRCARPPRR